MICSNILMIVCGTTHMETVNCIFGRYDNMKKGYKWYHKNVIKIMHWKLCEQCCLCKNEKWCKNVPEPVTENELMKLLQDVNIHRDLIPELKRRAIAVVDKVEKNSVIVAVAIRGDIEDHVKKIKNMKILGRRSNSLAEWKTCKLYQGFLMY